MATPTDPPQFDTSILSDPSKLSPLYSADAGQSADRLKMLQDAMTYAQAHPELPNSQYLLGELDKDIKAQSANTEYAKQSAGSQSFQSGTAAQQQYQTQLKAYQDAFNSLSQGKGLTSAQLAAIGDKDPSAPSRPIAAGNMNDSGIAYAMKFFGTRMGEINTALTNVTNQLSSGVGSTANINDAQKKLLENFRLSSPDYNTAAGKLRDYFYGKGGQIDLSTKPAINDIYQTAYNIKNKVNTQSAQIGAGNSGFRKKAIGNIGGQAIQEAAGVRGAAENEAQKNIQDFASQTAAQQRAQQDLENKLKLSGASGIYGTEGQQAISSYNTNTNAQLDEQLAKEQERLATQANSDQFANQLASGLTSGLGKFAGSFV